jgi:hypothetical protein
MIDNGLGFALVPRTSALGAADVGRYERYPGDHVESTVEKNRGCISTGATFPPVLSEFQSPQGI